MYFISINSAVFLHVRFMVEHDYKYYALHSQHLQEDFLYFD